MHLKSVEIFPEKFPVTDVYPFNIKLLRNSGKINFEKNVACFVGENGTGKSTLLRAICMKCSIHIWDADRRTRFEYNPYEERLHEALVVEWVDTAVKGTYFGSQIFESFARLLDEWAHNDPEQLEYFGGKSLLEQSHGQSLMSFFRARYKIKGLYFLDEPECALSPKTQLELKKLLEEYGASGRAQFIVATHSPILMSVKGAKIFGFDGDRILPVDYRETAHYSAYRDFFKTDALDK
ncbi:MAG: AAA family ATPase [Candidatus Goldiibacteriota bacterium]|jgi:predicted ATPase